MYAYPLANADTDCKLRLRCGPLLRPSLLMNIGGQGGLRASLSIYIVRSDPNMIDLNLRCAEGIDREDVRPEMRGLIVLLIRSS